MAGSGVLALPHAMVGAGQTEHFLFTAVNLSSPDNNFLIKKNPFHKEKNNYSVSVNSEREEKGIYE